MPLPRRIHEPDRLGGTSPRQHFQSDPVGETRIMPRAADRERSPVGSPTTSWGAGGLQQELGALRVQLAHVIRSQAEIRTVVQQVQLDVTAILANSATAAAAASGMPEEAKAVPSWSEAKMICRGSTNRDRGGTSTLDGIRPPFAVKPPFAPEAAGPERLLRELAPGEAGTGHEEDLHGTLRKKTTMRSPSDIMDAANKEELWKLLARAEAEEQNEARLAAAKQDRVKYAKSVMRSMSTSQWELVLDSVMGLIIQANAIYIGVAMDYDTGTPAWVAVDVFFSASFCTELFIKWYLKGLRGMYSGSSRFSNMFDTCIILADLIELFIQYCLANGAQLMANAPAASLARMCRLVKLVALLRVLRNEIFADLITMVTGMVGGMTTLLWSMLLFFLVIYVMSLVFREILASRYVEKLSDPFSSVPQALLTTFRCSFGDCNTFDGTPILPIVIAEYGTGPAIVGCMFIFGVTIGVFNVISAIFVESTMTAASAMGKQRHKEKLEDARLWSVSMVKLIRRLIHLSDYDIPHNLLDSIDELWKVDVDCPVIDALVKDPMAIKALKDLGIDHEDYHLLSGILDPDCGGSVAIWDLVDGIHRLRGKPRRSDIVTVDLVVRSIQQKVVQIQHDMGEIRGSLLQSLSAGLRPESQMAHAGASQT